MKRALRCTVAIFIVAATMTVCGHGYAETNPPVAPNEWVPLEQLLLPTPPPEKGKYAILVGQFADAARADGTRHRVTDHGLVSSIIPVVDKNGQHWFVVSAGSFESLDDARSRRGAISRDLGSSDLLPIILLPPDESPSGPPVTLRISWAVKSWRTYLDEFRESVLHLAA